MGSRDPSVHCQTVPGSGQWGSIVCVQWHENATTPRWLCGGEPYGSVLCVGARCGFAHAVVRVGAVRFLFGMFGIGFELSNLCRYTTMR